MWGHALWAKCPKIIYHVLCKPSCWNSDFTRSQYFRALFPEGQYSSFMRNGPLWRRVPLSSVEVNFLCQPLITWGNKAQPERLWQRQVHLNGGVDEKAGRENLWASSLVEKTSTRLAVIHQDPGAHHGSLTQYNLSKGSNYEISPISTPCSFSLDFSLFATFSLSPDLQLKESNSLYTHPSGLSHNVLYHTGISSWFFLTSNIIHTYEFVRGVCSC